MIRKILIIEDDKGIQTYIKELMLENRYSVETSTDGIQALNMLNHSQPDLVLLDLGLPKITGESICAHIKKHYPDLPVIILTAKDTPADIAKGLNLGADDYIAKPFEPEVLIARVNARLRHKNNFDLKVADLQLDNQTFTAIRAGKQIILSPNEFKLLEYLLSNKDKVLTREMILSRVWQYSFDVDTRVVDVYVGYLRKKIDKGFKKKLIHSVRGFGYMIKG